MPLTIVFLTQTAPADEESEVSRYKQNEKKNASKRPERNVFGRLNIAITNLFRSLVRFSQPAFGLRHKLEVHEKWSLGWETERRN
jgi:hypothetical protein